MKPNKLRFLSGNALKLIAAAAMLVDHVGFMFFPGVRLLRMIGRLAFPIFAYMIAEGCRYTRSRTRYLLPLAGMAAVFQLVYYVVDGSLYMCIFVSFTLACLMIYALDNLARSIRERRGVFSVACRVITLLLSVAFAAGFCEVFTVDYGFSGTLVPVFAYLPVMFIKTDCDICTVPMQVISAGIPLVILAYISGMSQWYSLLTLPLLLLYSGKRGKRNMKYFFYVFYPAHLVLLWVIDYVLQIL